MAAGQAGRTNNVELVHEGLRALGEGDLEGALRIWHPDVVYWGFDTTGGDPREFRGRDAFFAMLAEAASHVDEFTNELIDAYAFGDNIVACHYRGTRRAKGGRAQTFEFAQLLRFDDGVITFGADVVDPAAQGFWRALQATL